MRASLLPVASSETSTPVVNALCDTYVNVARHDFPGLWPTIPHELGAALTSGDVRRTLVALRALYALARFFKWKKFSPPTASPYLLLVNALMVALQQLGAHLVTQLPTAAPEPALALRLVLKVYLASIYFRFSDYRALCEPGAFGRWATLCCDVLRAPLPPPGMSGCPSEPEERAQWAPWKAKKWAARVLARVAERWAAPKEDPDDPEEDESAAKPAAALFKSTVAPAAVGLALEQLVAWAVERGGSGSERGGLAWLSRPVRATYYALLNETSAFKAVWVPLKPHLRTIITSLVPLDMSATEAESQDFTESPEEWLVAEQGSNVFDTGSDPRNSAELLLIALIGQRKKSALPLLEEFTEAVLRAPRNPLAKDTLLRMLTAVSARLVRSKKWRGNMEGILTAFVTPEIGDGTAPAMLRARAIQFWEHFTDPDWRVSDGAQLAACEAVFRCMGDPCLPIRQVAASAIAAFIANCSACRTAMRPFVPAIVERLAVLCQEVGLDRVVSTLNLLVQVYHAEAPTLAGPVVAIVTRQALSLLEAGAEDEATEDEFAVATDTCFTVVKEVVRLLQTPPEGASGAALPASMAREYHLAAQPVLRGSVIPAAFSLLRRFLDYERGDTSEWLDNALELLGDLVDALEGEGLEGNSPAWTLVVAAQRYVKRWGADYVVAWAYPTQAAIAWGARAGALGAPVPTEWGPVDFVDELLGVLESVGEECAEDEQATGSRTAAFTLLPHGRGAVDRHLGRVVGLYAATLLRARTEALIADATGVLCSALQYNAAAALAALLARDDAPAVLNKMFGELSRVATLPDKCASLRAAADAATTQKAKARALEEVAEAEKRKPVIAAQAGALAMGCALRAAAAGALPTPLLPQLGAMAALGLRLAVAEGGWRLALEAKRGARAAEAARTEAEDGAAGGGAAEEEEKDDDDGVGGDDDGSAESGDGYGDYGDDDDEEEEECGELEGPQCHINTPMFYMASVRAARASPARAAVEAALGDSSLAAMLQAVTQHVETLEAQGVPVPELAPPPLE